jgi:hypothetical protein
VLDLKQFVTALLEKDFLLKMTAEERLSIVERSDGALREPLATAEGEAALEMVKRASLRYFAAGFTFRRFMRAIELYSKPVNFGFSIVGSAFQ